MERLAAALRDVVRMTGGATAGGFAASRDRPAGGARAMSVL